MKYEEFIAGVATNAELSEEQAATLAVTPGEFDDVLGQLPSDFRRLGTSQPR